MNKEFFAGNIAKRGIVKTGIVTCALGTMWRVEARWVENNESLFFLIFGTTPGTPTATENRRGGWAGNAAVVEATACSLRSQCGGRRILLD